MGTSSTTTPKSRYRVKTDLRITYQPWAECIVEGCGWARNARLGNRAEARAHVRDTGHDVVVVIEDRTLYTREQVSS
jgi:hypothetical protein